MKAGENFKVGQPVWVDMSRPEDGYVGRYEGIMADPEPDFLDTHLGVNIAKAPNSDGSTLWWIHRKKIFPRKITV